MSDAGYLALDLGAESGRGVVGTISDGVLALREVHRFLNPTARMLGRLHWNLPGQWEEVKTAVRKAAGAGGGEVASIGVDTWGVDFGLLNRDGDLLSNPVHYRDRRTDGIMPRAFAIVARERIFQRTGVQMMVLNTLFQLLALRETQPKLLESAGTLLMIPDLFNYLFTGEKRSELSIASTTQMLDPRTRTWALDLLNEFSLPTDLFAPIVPPGTRIGMLAKDVAEECGAPAIAVIAPAAHDTASAVAAAPLDRPREDWCYISSGTWSLMGAELPAPLINPRAMEFNFSNEIGIGGTIRLLKNIMGLWLVQECRRFWGREGREYSYGELTAMAAAAKPFTCLLNPGHAPFLAPGDMPNKIARFCQQGGQPAPADPAQTVRACLESLALTYRKTLEELEALLGRRLEVIHILGGGAQNELLNQMTADACARPVVAGPVEATAIGNVLVQAIAMGQVASIEAGRRMVRASFAVKTYQPRETKPWDGAYARYRDVLKERG
ncbi:MAG TPA: rhamnulokinase family protein [Tepidisphaeraceae bacterium]